MSDDKIKTPDEQEFELDGEKLTAAQIRELKANGMRQSDYTKKTQDLAEKTKGVVTLGTLLARLKDGDEDAEAELNDYVKSLKKERQDPTNTKAENKDIDRKLAKTQEELEAVKFEQYCDKLAAKDPVFAKNREAILKYAADEKCATVAQAIKLWKIDNPDKAKIREDDGSPIIRGKHSGSDSSATKFDKKKDNPTDHVLKRLKELGY